MGAANDIYKLIQKFTLLGVECLITRYFRQSTAPGSAGAVLSAWLADKLPEIMLNVSDDVTATSCEVQNLSNTSDFATTSGIGLIGTYPGEVLPPFTAIGLEFPSGDRKIRASTCRLPGPTEGTITDGVPTAGAITSWDYVAGVLADTLLHATSTYEPCLYTDGNTRTGFLPFTIDITDGYFSRITTQNSRKS